MSQEAVIDPDASEMFRRVVFAMWKAREETLEPRLGRNNPDDLDFAAGTLTLVAKMARAGMGAMKYRDDDEDILVRVSNSERMDAVSLALAWDEMIDAALGVPERTPPPRGANVVRLVRPARTPKPRREG